MTKTELMENYTAEQLADKVIELEIIIDNKLGGWSKHGISYNDFFSMQDEIEKLKSEVEKYRKAFEEAKKERDCQIAEYRKKIEELSDEKESIEMRLKLLKKDRDDLREETEKLKKTQDFSALEPIAVAEMLINAEGEYKRNPVAKAFCGNDKGTYRILGISELRQIAEHLLVYCNHNGEAKE